MSMEHLVGIFIGLPVVLFIVVAGLLDATSLSEFGEVRLTGGGTVRVLVPKTTPFARKALRLLNGDQAPLVRLTYRGSVDLTHTQALKTAKALSGGGYLVHPSHGQSGGLCVYALEVGEDPSRARMAFGLGVVTRLSEREAGELQRMLVAAVKQLPHSAGPSLEGRDPSLDDCRYFVAHGEGDLLLDSADHLAALGDPATDASLLRLALAAHAQDRQMAERLLVALRRLEARGDTATG